MHQKAQARLFPASKSKIIATSILRGAVSLGTTRLRVLQDVSSYCHAAGSSGFIRYDPIEGTARP